MSKMLFPAAVIIALTHGAEAQQSDIQSMISSQLDAFERNDVDQAFSYASPMIQRLFQTPQIFGQMVKQGYPMVWRPGAVRYLDLKEDGGRMRQQVEITDADGRVHLLEYEVIRFETGWKINGVRMLARPEMSV